MAKVLTFPGVGRPNQQRPAELPRGVLDFVQRRKDLDERLNEEINAHLAATFALQRKMSKLYAR